MSSIISVINIFHHQLFLLYYSLDWLNKKLKGISDKLLSPVSFFFLDYPVKCLDIFLILIPQCSLMESIFGNLGGTTMLPLPSLLWWHVPPFTLSTSVATFISSISLITFLSEFGGIHPSVLMLSRLFWHQGRQNQLHLPFWITKRHQKGHIV